MCISKLLKLGGEEVGIAIANGHVHGHEMGNTGEGPKSSTAFELSRHLGVAMLKRFMAFGTSEINNCRIMRKRTFNHPFLILIGVILLEPIFLNCIALAEKQPTAIGTRWELFVDDTLIHKQRDISLRLNPPERREIVLVTDAPWEGNASAYFSVIQDGEVIRLYYRGSIPGTDESVNQVTCVAESRDGINFTRPKLGLIEVNGTKDNNVIWHGVESHNFAPFIDQNPACKPEERYKALAGLKSSGGLFAFSSHDGIHWKKMREEPVIRTGDFDSLNLAFWDSARGRYACYSRIFLEGIRAVQSAYSDSFMEWSEPVPNQYADGIPLEHFYTSATLPCPGAEHLLIAFPKRFVPERTKLSEADSGGLSDALFMSSRDGIHWNRTFLEAWVRPGLDQKNWTHRNNMPAWGIAETARGEWSLYISEHYQWPDNRLRRLVLPRHRIASITALAGGGEFTTLPMTFTGERLVLNYSTSAAGSILVEVQDETGTPIPGHALAEMPPLFGDSLEETIYWKSGSDVSPLRGKPVRLRFVLRDAAIFAFSFQPFL